MNSLVRGLICINFMRSSGVFVSVFSIEIVARASTMIIISLVRVTFVKSNVFRALARIS
jgi:hypothetical protein